MAEKEGFARLRAGRLGLQGAPGALPSALGFESCQTDVKAARPMAEPLSHGGGCRIRTRVGLRPNGFQDRPVMTASVTLHVY